MYSGGRRTGSLEVTYANGDKEVLYFRTSAPGRNARTSSRAERNPAIKGSSTPDEGHRLQHLLAACDSSARTRIFHFDEPDDWGTDPGKKVSGSSSSARWSRATGRRAGRTIDNVANTGHPVPRSDRWEPLERR